MSKTVKQVMKSQQAKTAEHLSYQVVVFFSCSFLASHKMLFMSGSCVFIFSQQVCSTASWVLLVIAELFDGSVQNFLFFLPEMTLIDNR